MKVGAVGMSGKTYEKVKAVVEAAEDDPEQFSDLVEKMDATGKVDPQFKELQRRREKGDTPDVEPDDPSSAHLLTRMPCPTALATASFSALHLARTSCARAW